MSGRPVEPVEIPPACPFVAFEDDRDRRSTAPDHRHRCYAEPRPAPRALAHQERYCLTRDFPSCPTFQAWARREAARESEPGAAREVAAGRPPADPGVWLSGSGGTAAGAAAAGAAAAGAATVAPSLAAAGPSMAAAGAAAGRGSRRPVRPSPSEAGQLAAFEEPDPGPAEEPDGGGHEELAALVGGAAAGAAAGGPSSSVAAGSDAAASDVPAFLAARPPGTRSGAAAGRPPRGGSVAGKLPDGDNPPWERPRRAEFYPTLRTRTGMPNVPPVALALIALVIAALGLFILPSLFGNPGGAGPSNSASTAPSSAATSGAPTLAAGPTPQTYTVKSGDLLSTIAKHFGVSLADLEAANPQIKDFNKITPGDKITIPVPGTSGGPSPTV